MQGVRHNRALLQDMQFLRKSQVIKSSTSPVECYVCGKGLQDGYSVTAKTFQNGTVLFCDVHYPLQ